MDAATPRPLAAAIPAALAGMQSGLVGAFCMVMWLGILAEWQQRNFWIPVNLMASAFYGAGAVRSGFAPETVSGLAVYIALYTLLGATLAVVLRDRVSRLRTLLIGMAFALYQMKIVLGTMLLRARFRSATSRPARVKRDGITLAPAGGAKVILLDRSPRPLVG